MDIVDPPPGIDHTLHHFFMVILIIIYISLSNTIALLPIEIYLFQGSPVLYADNATVYMLLSKPASKPVQFQLFDGNTKKFTNFPCKLLTYV